MKNMHDEEITLESLIYFESKLRQWHHDLIQDTQSMLHNLQEETHPTPDFFDQATLHEGWRSNFYLLKNKEMLLQEIEEALQRIKEGTYGYSELSGDPIELGRLDAWPIARFTTAEEEQRRRKAHR